jgi:hypothetical protein
MRVVMVANGKVAQNEITEELPGGRKGVRFPPVAPHLTEGAMRTLHGRYADVSGPAS